RLRDRLRGLEARMSVTQPSNSPRDHVAGLESIRVVCALWVMLSHLPLAPFYAFLPASWQPHALWFEKAAISGPAAVIVFFVISGFCIHYPYRHAAQLPIARFLVRRYVRILLPLVAAVWLGAWLHYSLRDFESTILWSLFAELLYYTAYPLLFRLRSRLGFKWLLGLSAIAAGVVVATNPFAGNYPSYGIVPTALLGLPCWLLGCVLAERADTLRPDGNRSRIWAWRIGVWVVSCLCMALRFKTPIGYPLTLDFFACLCYAWLAREVAYYRVRREPALTRWGGAFSYTIYLTHILAYAVLVRSWPAIPWWTMVPANLALAYGFHLAVERPAHGLARRLAGALRSEPIGPSASEAA
ncbi:MAG TPA: acyltransferase, partial [Oscillatoriaceae cyanobacterium]